ncbi:AraC family transcriptional regulator [Acaryochloris sp. IP29b_bin.148]|uniref:helix-turn-helix transcriptional regulator n=1 Tax=Acaryochloris sp. IP29b_bin.148 TaxID=2969218 RepID=UPI00262E6E34|nr:AraC family transcriptional regulator [Acaryochloris sp. IP29b_bin.148]
MTLFLSVPEFLSQQADETSLRKAIRQPWTIPLKDRTGNSHGYQQRVKLRPGLHLQIDDYTLQDDLIVDLGEDKPCAPYQHLEMSFMLSGHNLHEKMQPDHSFILAEWKESLGAKFNWQADERVLKFDIHIESTLFETLVGEQLEVLPSLLKQIVQNPHLNQNQFQHVQPTTAAMRSAVHQILHCPYQGLTRWLYWESKVIELIALRLEQVSSISSQAVTISGLQAESVDRIHYASTILHQRLDNPPSLLELSRLAGLNDCTLKQGFRQVFGTTVFGYLIQRRMEKACQLLKQQQSIAIVAAAVGYASSTTFSRTFRQRFGVSPKEYQRGKL